MSIADGLFMSVAEALGPASKSFEEIRMEDYIKAYQTTGRPPAPVPQEPADEVARKALGLPPLFKPLPVTAAGTSSALTASISTLAQRIVSPAALPAAQEFRLRAADAEKYHDISCMTEYEFFSHEELRYYAYLAGNKFPPHAIKMDPFVSPAKDTPAAAAAAASGDDKLQSLVAQPGYERHSPEEFRIAFLLHGREMTSADLDQLQNRAAAPAIAPLLPATPIALSPMPMSALPQPVYASTTPSIPKFSFGFK